MTRAISWLAVLAVAAACSKETEPPAAAGQPLVPAPELERGREACAAYVAKVCLCAETMPGLVEQCRLARALPPALEVQQDIGTAPNVERKDAVSLAIALRKTIKTCIDEVAKLPTLGCR